MRFAIREKCSVNRSLRPVRRASTSSRRVLHWPTASTSPDELSPLSTQSSSSCGTSSEFPAPSARSRS